MKTLRNDTRYIIKKVIIGVLIAIVLFNARKCGVYALESDYYFWGSNVSGVNVSTQLNVCTSTLNSCYTEIDTIDYNGSKLHFYLQNRYKGTYDTSNIWFYEYNNEIYFFGFFANQNTLSNYDYDYINIEKNSTYNYPIAPPNFMLMKNDKIVVNTANIDNNVSYLKSYYYKIDFSVINTSSKFLSAFSSNINNSNGLLLNDILENGSFIATNSSVSLYYNNIEITPPDFPPTGYQELSLKDYQGVVFVPKNYNDIKCSVVGDLCNTTFDYYYQEEIKEAYFPLDNRFNIRFNSDFLNSPNDPSELKSTYFPISQVSVNETFYYAFMIYNYTNDGSPLDPNNYYAYGDAKVWYDSTLWNYYLVDDFNTWSANVCYMLDGKEVCTTISGLPTLKDAIEQAQLEDNILGTHVGDLNLFSSIIRFPLGFVQSLSSESCTAIQLPPLPFIGGNISLPCMSLIYQQVLGIYQPVISGFINFIIIYYLIVALIKFYNKTFDPSHTEIEVIDL